MVTLITEVPNLLSFSLLLLVIHNLIIPIPPQQPLIGSIINRRSPIILLKPLPTANSSATAVVVLVLAPPPEPFSSAPAASAGALGRWPGAGAELIPGAIIGEVSLGATLEAPGGVGVVHALAYELGGAAVVGGDGGGECAAVEDLAVHL